MDSRAALSEGIALFNRAQFFAAHEVWEEAWRVAPEIEKGFLGALIQFAAGMVQAQRGKVTGAETLLNRASAGLAVLPSEVLGLEVDEVEALLQLAREALSEGTLSTAKLQLASAGDRGDSGDAFCAAKCPYCGETVEVRADSVGPSSESYVEDCSVCCRPWVVSISRDGAGV